MLQFLFKTLSVTVFSQYCELYIPSLLRQQWTDKAQTYVHHIWLYNYNNLGCLWYSSPNNATDFGRVYGKWLEWEDTKRKFWFVLCWLVSRRISCTNLVFNFWRTGERFFCWRYCKGFWRGNKQAIKWRSQGNFQRYEAMFWVWFEKWLFVNKKSDRD